MKDKMRFLMENSKNKQEASRRICKECNIVVTMEASDFQNGICPGCGNEFTDLTESVGIESSKHFTCPKCKTVKPYTRINEDECPVCDSLMTVFAVPEIKKDHGVPINTD
jgi:ssDNA-binding Zn-finger/Zn-ribbon topoisomerase 1